MKLFDNNPDFTRLDDDVSFQILRTNPNLTTNTKLMYDGQNMYLESYSANALLATNTYKNYQVYKTGLFNRDLRNFLLNTGSSAYILGQRMSDTVIGDSFDYQFENMYWCGAESINSAKYPQELGIVAPIYLRKKRPDYFVIFKIDTPANTNLTESNLDETYDFKSDIFDKMKIIKSFDLREGTVIGDYISNYVSQKDFNYDQSVYVNFTAKQIYYYGIDKSQGVLTQKVETITEQMLENDNCILRTDDWISNGFERNNLIFPYIMNIEFLFDDNETEEYKFARYFGMYCNATDLYDVDASYFKDNMTLVLSDDDRPTISDDYVNYIKDKSNNIYSIDSNYVVSGDVDIDDISGYESSTVSTYCEKLEGVGKATMVIKINSELEPGDKVFLYDNTETEDGDISEDDSEYNANPNIIQFIASNKLEAGEYKGLYFSCLGTIAETATALATAIANYDDGQYQWITSYSDDNKVVIKASHVGSELNGAFDIGFSDTITYNNKITALVDVFDGGTDVDGCMFLVKTSDKNMFFDTSGEDRDMYRYIQCYNGRDNAKILKLIPYITEDNEVDETYSVIITDYNGQYVNVSKTNMIEMLDRYYAKIGLLSFFPVKDFDFDTVTSQYSEDTMMKNEISTIDETFDSSGLKSDTQDVTLTFNVDIPEDTMDFTISVTSNTVAALSTLNSKTTNISYGRFFASNGDEIDNEYDYFMENIIPNLSVINKTVPFITKWGYMDDSKDSCENPYRLNSSKIFDTCNFSANTYMKKGDIQEYTHSMPYYVNDVYTDSINEYHYVNNPFTNTNSVDDWISKFTVRDTGNVDDPFDLMFSMPSLYENKRFNRKYSRFLMGNSIRNASTLFRGVKFEIVNYVKGKEVKTSKYNDYKFSFVYIPTDNIDMFMSITDSDSDPDTESYNRVYFVKNDDFKFIVGMCFFYTPNVSEYTFNKAYVYAGCLGYISSDNDFDFNEMGAYYIKNSINSGTNVIYTNVTDESNTTYKIKVVDPDNVNVYDIFTTSPVVVKYNNKSIIGSVEVGLKSSVNNLSLKTINRYSGYYNPIFKDILFYEDYPDCKFSNTSFDYDYSDLYGSFGVINNMWYHKVNEDKSLNLITTLTPYYPMIGQYCLSFKDYNIFSSNWDKQYYSRQLDQNTIELCNSIPSMKNGLCMFGSKYLNTPETIEIECFIDGGDWNDDLITNTSGYTGEVMYKEVNNTNANFYFFLHNRILRYFYNMLKDEFAKYINPLYSYGTIDSLEDDIKEYTEKNILKLYQLDSIRTFVKRTKMGVNNNKIENDYSAYLDKTVDELKSDGFEEIKNVSLSKVSTDNFDRKLVYNLRTGEQEYLGFSFIIKKI